NMHCFPLGFPAFRPAMVLGQIPGVDRPRIVEITLALARGGDQRPVDGAFVLPEAVGLRGCIPFLDQLAAAPDPNSHVPAAPPAIIPPAARFWIFCRSHRLPLVPIGPAVRSWGVWTLAMLVTAGVPVG